MSRRFTLADLFLWLSFVALVLAFVVPITRFVRNAGDVEKMVLSVAASADGSTFAALLGDGRVLVWDGSGAFRATLTTQSQADGEVALSFDGRTAVISGEWNHAGDASLLMAACYDVATGEITQVRAPSFKARLATSPTRDTLAIVDKTSTKLYSMADDSEMGSNASGGTCGRFSPDGKQFAVATLTAGVQIYDTATNRLVKQLATPDSSVSWHYADLTWSPDGNELAGLCTFTDDSLQTIQTWSVDTGKAKNVTLPLEESFESLAYVEDGRYLALAGVHSGMMLLDVTQLDPAMAKRNEGPSRVAAGLSGSPFITANWSEVDLWDAAALRPKRRLYEAWPFPNVWPAVGGFFVWSWLFGMRRARRLRRACGTCGQLFQPTGKKDKNEDCYVCRQKSLAKNLTPAEAARHSRRVQRKVILILCIVDAVLAAAVGMVGLLLQLPRPTSAIFGFWPLFALTAIAAPTALIGFLYAYLLWKRRRAKSPAVDAALADAAAGAPGTVRRIGEMRVWSASGTVLADLLAAEIEATREKLQAAIGRDLPLPTARAYFFADGETLSRYLTGFGVQLGPVLAPKAFYWRAPERRMLVGERQVREQDADPHVTLRSLLLYCLLEDLHGRPPAAWIEQGLVTTLAHDNEQQELARLQRRMAAGQAAGRTIGAAEMLATTAKGLWQKYAKSEFVHFAWRSQFTAQSWSVTEFLCGRGSTSERRSAFQRFFNDADRRKRPAETFARHFGFTFAELLEQWQAWVAEQVTDEHHPPPEHLAKYLAEGPTAKIACPDTPPGERVAAVRELGEQGYLVGVEHLIAVLEHENKELRCEAVWALECISGKALGGSAAAWQNWWESLQSIHSQQLRRAR